LGPLGVLGLVACFATSSCHLIVPPKIMIVMMENQGYSDVIGNPALPFINNLAWHYGLATQSYGSG
jgi:hypothetical protein